MVFSRTVCQQSITGEMARLHPVMGQAALVAQFHNDGLRTQPPQGIRYLDGFTG